MLGHALPGDWFLMFGSQAPAAEDDKDLRRGEMRYCVFLSRSVMLPADGAPRKDGATVTDVSRANQKNELPILFALLSPWPPVNYVGC